MKKTKLDRRIENALNAFFDANVEEGAANLVFAGNALPSTTSQDQTVLRKTDKLIKVFKKVFLFFPGVLMLHLACFSTALFYKDFGLNFQMLFFFAAGILMVWAGLGSLNNKKHLFLSLSVILSILPFAVLQSFLPVGTIEYSFYLFPLFFAVPILVKGRLDKIENS